MELVKRPDKAGYETRMGGIRSHVIVGGRDLPANKFVPSMNLSAHNDEAWLDLNHIDTPMSGRIDTIENGRISHEGGGFKHEFYTIDSGRMKWDILFDVMPPDTIRFRVRHSDNLSFHRQVLSQADIDNGNEYIVPEVENSFAVYMDKRDNQYQTGKVCHIYSPFYIDEAGARSPLLDMDITPDIDNAKMLILSNTPEVISWLNDPARVGKFRLDPVIGYDTVGSSQAKINGLVWHTIQTQAGIGGAIVSLHAAGGSAPSGKFKVSVANCDQSNPYDPEGHSLIAEGEGTILNGQSDILAPTIYAPVLPGTWYRVGLSMEVNIAIRYDNITTYSPHRYGQTYGIEMQDPVPVTDVITTGSHVSVWAVYETSHETSAEGTYTRKDLPDTNYNADNFIIAGWGPNNSFRSIGFLIWDISDILTGSTIDVGDLLFTVLQFKAAGINTISRVLRQDMVASEATYNSYKTGSAWTSGCCDDDGTDYTSANEVTYNATSDGESFLKDIKAMIQDAVDAGDQYLILKFWADRAWTSWDNDTIGDQASGLESDRPQLNIEWTPPQGGYYQRELRKRRAA